MQKARGQFSVTNIYLPRAKALKPSGVAIIAGYIWGMHRFTSLSVLYQVGGECLHGAPCAAKLTSSKC